MNYWKITNSAIVEVHSVNSLLAAWGFYGEDSGVSRFVITEPITTSRLKRLPVALRNMLQYTKTQPA